MTLGSAANTYLGGTTVNNGVLNVNTGSNGTFNELGTGQITVSSAGTLNVNLTAGTSPNAFNAWNGTGTVVITSPANGTSFTFTGPSAYITGGMGNGNFNGLLVLNSTIGGNNSLFTIQNGGLNGGTIQINNNASLDIDTVINSAIIVTGSAAQTRVTPPWITTAT